MNSLPSLPDDLIETVCQLRHEADLLEEIERLREENQVLRIRLFAALCIECGKKAKNQIYYPQFHCSRCGKPFAQVIAHQEVRE